MRKNKFGHEEKSTADSRCLKVKPKNELACAFDSSNFTHISKRLSIKRLGNYWSVFTHLQSHVGFLWHFDAVRMVYYSFIAMGPSMPLKGRQAQTIHWFEFQYYFVKHGTIYCARRWLRLMPKPFFGKKGAVCGLGAQLKASRAHRNVTKNSVKVLVLSTY